MFRADPPPPQDQDGLHPHQAPPQDRDGLYPHQGNPPRIGMVCIHIKVTPPQDRDGLHPHGFDKTKAQMWMQTILILGGYLNVDADHPDPGGGLP